MQVLQDGRVNFISVAGVTLLISLWICLGSFHSSRFYCITLERKKNLLLTLSPPSRFCWSSWKLQAEGGQSLLFFFSLLWFCLRISIWVTIFRGIEPLAQSPQSTEQNTLSISTCPMVPLIHLIVPSFDQSMKCTQWEQLAPILPLCWSWPCAQAKSHQGCLAPLLN